MSSATGHTPVLLDEVVSSLNPQKGERILDCTLGAGGHAAALTKKTNPDGTLVCFDADERNLAIAQQSLKQFGDRITYIHDNFKYLLEHKVGTFDCILADLGISSLHADEPERGFSYKNDGPLDMRFNQASGLSAAHMIRAIDYNSLIDILKKYGEVKKSVKLAQVIKDKQPTTTHELKDIVEKIDRHATAQVFQALRIHINKELDALAVLLEHMSDLLNPGGRIAIISFHSLEDRMVKKRFRELTTAEKDHFTGHDKEEAPFEDLTRKPITPSEEEIAKNPRARSAKLRVVRKRK